MKIRVIPDNTLNNDNLESMLINLHQHKNMADRLYLSKQDPLKVKFNTTQINIPKVKLTDQFNIVYEMYISKKDISFHYQVPEELNDIAKNEFSICYPKSTVQEEPLKAIDIAGAVELELDQHSFLSLRVDKRGEYPLNSLLESSRMLRDDEVVLIQYILSPVEDNWYLDASQAVEEFHGKSLRKKIRLDKKHIARTALKFSYYAIGEVMDMMSLLLTNEGYTMDKLDEIENSFLFRNGLSENTKLKSNCIAYDTTVRIATNSKDRHELLLTLFSRSFNTLNEDNKLVQKEVDFEKLKKAMMKRETLFKFNRDILSTREVAQLIQLPTITYQQLYHIQSIDARELEVPTIFTKPGIQIGWARYKGRKYPVNIPIKDFKKLTKEEADSLCQVWLSIGKMGSGKTTNGENQAIQMLKNGFSVFAVDVADGKLVDNIHAGLPKNFEKSIMLDFGDTDNPIALTWNETAMLGSNHGAETKLASQLRNFLNKLSKEPTSDRMDRFLGACAKATFKNPKANLYDVVLCITDADFRHKIIRDNNIEGRLKYTLEQMDDSNISRTLTGIMDRLDGILDNEYAANCLLQTPNPEINFRKWADEGYFVGIKIPKDKLLDDATDLLVTYVVSKLWLSILTRSDVAIEERRPCFLILDEPHQFPTVLKELYNIIREMRKWRLGLIVLAHEFGDFRTMKSLLKNAGTNYFIYTTGKDTYRELLEEMSPYTLEECLRTKWHHAIVNMRFQTHMLCTMTEMLQPLPKTTKPSLPNLFGRPYEEVQEEILNRMMNTNPAKK